MPDAEVLIEGTPGDREVRTDADGQFVVHGVVADSPTNEVEVRAGVLQVRTEVKLEPGRDVDDLLLRLASAPYLSGRVLDAEGRPVVCVV